MESHPNMDSDKSATRPSSDGSQRPHNDAKDVEKTSPPLRRSASEGSTAHAAMAEDPFGDEEGAEVKYRTLTWWQAGFSKLILHSLVYPRWSEVLTLHT